MDYTRTTQQGKSTALDSLNAEMSAFLGMKNVPVSKNQGSSQSQSLKSAKVNVTSSSSNSSPLCGSPRVAGGSGGFGNFMSATSMGGPASMATGGATSSPASIAGMRPMAPHQPTSGFPTDAFASLTGMGVSTPPMSSFASTKTAGPQQPFSFSPPAAANSGFASDPFASLSGMSNPPLNSFANTKTTSGLQQPSVFSPPAAATSDAVWDSLFGPGTSTKAASAPSPNTTTTKTTPAFDHSFYDTTAGSELQNEDDTHPPPPTSLSAGAAKEKAAQLYKQGQYPDGVKWYTWAIQLATQGNSGSVVLCDLFCHRSECYKELGQVKKAAEDCSNALELSPSDIAALTRRAFLYESMEKYKLAKKDLEAIISLQPSNSGASRSLVRIQKCIDSL